MNQYNTKNNENILLSIITPAYNASDFIADTIHNIEPQLTNSVEWIIINDGSKDQTLNIIEKEVKNNKNIKIISTVNKGAGHARNIGIKEAKGEWISFLDADDLYTTDSILKIIKYLEKVPNDTEIVYTPKIYSSFDLKEQNILWPEEKILNDMPMLEFVTSIYKRYFLNTNKVRFFEYKQQDIESAFRYLAFSQVSNLIITRELIFYCHRNNPTSNTHTWNNAVLYYTKAKVYFLIYKRFKNKKLKSLFYVQNIYHTCIKEIIEKKLYNKLSIIKCLIILKNNRYMINKSNNNSKKEMINFSKIIIKYIFSIL